MLSTRGRAGGSFWQRRGDKTSLHVCSPVLTRYTVQCFCTICIVLTHSIVHVAVHNCTMQLYTVHPNYCCFVIVQPIFGANQGQIGCGPTPCFSSWLWVAGGRLGGQLHTTPTDSVNSPYKAVVIAVGCTFPQWGECNINSAKGKFIIWHVRQTYGGRTVDGQWTVHIFIFPPPSVSSPCWETVGEPGEEEGGRARTDMRRVAPMSSFKKFIISLMRVEYV